MVLTIFSLFLSLFCPFVHAQNNPFHLQDFYTGSTTRAIVVDSPLLLQWAASVIVMTVAQAHLSLHHLLHVIIYIFILNHVNSLDPSEHDTLLELKSSLTNGEKLASWKPLTDPCNGNEPNWEGVLCMNDTVWGIRLEGKELGGNIDTKILMNLPSLITISFQNNSLEGEFPEFKRLRRLRSIFLTANKFSKGIPTDAFDGMRRLKKLYLANNDFEGQIPSSLTTLPKLRDLMLENNRFEGAIPVFVKDNLTYVNFANNKLNGPIPQRLQKFPKNIFSGNKELCGPPLGECEPKLPESTIIMVALVVVAALAAITLAVIILQQFGRSSKDALQIPTYKKGASPDHDQMEQGCGKAAATVAAKKASLNLYFLKDDAEKFDLADLLKGSAVVLGGGVFGSSYKTTLTRGKVLVAKRYNQMNNVTRDEFFKHMKKLGKLNHPNLVPLIAFYYRKEEKLIVADYVENISLAVHLHGSRSDRRKSLNWPTRLKIVKGIARGLLHLYTELPSLIAPHGHLKSSNVLLNQEFESLLTDYGLVPITNQEHARDVMIAFKSPEYKQHGRITKKTDVWSLGVLILEIMTGKFPANTFHSKGGDTELTNFVESMFKEEVSINMFDKEIGGFDGHNEGEMLKLLTIGLSCCEPDVEKRWDIRETVDRIEKVKEKNKNDNDKDDNDDY